MRATRIAATIALAASTLCGRAQTPATMLEKARPATFRIDAAQCSGHDHSATGFLWSDGSTVITALHAVAGCRNLSVFSETLLRQIPATLVHSLNSADLAMLRLQSPVGNAQPLTLSTQKPAVHDEVTVLGYALVVARMESTELKVRFGGNHLEEIIPVKDMEELVARRSPSPDLEVTSLEGNLAPGTSGAPIMDRSGKVVAIGDGGLENGTVGMAWGVPVSYLPALAQSRDVPTAATADPHLFAAEIDVHPIGDAVHCGSGSFIKVRTLQYQEILHSTDDAAGLEKLLNYFGFLGVNPSQLGYDIYQDATSGAALAVPEGKVLQSGNAGCRVDVLPNLSMYIQMAQLSRPSDMYPVSLAFERTFAPMPPWAPNPNFTYLQPRQRADGLTVERKALYHVARNNFGQLYWDQGALYETLAVKGNWFVGTIALDTVYKAAAIQLAQQCQMRPAFPGCEDFRAKMRVLVQAVIAAHLTTFPSN
jgi:hypothetical protein